MGQGSSVEPAGEGRRPAGCRPPPRPGPPACASTSWWARPGGRTADRSIDTSPCTARRHIARVSVSCVRSNESLWNECERHMPCSSMKPPDGSWQQQRVACTQRADEKLLSAGQEGAPHRCRSRTCFAVLAASASGAHRNLGPQRQEISRWIGERASLVREQVHMITVLVSVRG